MCETYRTLSCVHTALGKHLPFGVLESKSTKDDTMIDPQIFALMPIKMSKFLWATDI
jgi:hypothetical protein